MNMPKNKTQLIKFLRENAGIEFIYSKEVKWGGSNEIEITKNERIKMLKAQTNAMVIKKDVKRNGEPHFIESWLWWDSKRVKRQWICTEDYFEIIETQPQEENGFYARFKFEYVKGGE